MDPTGTRSVDILVRDASGRAFVQMRDGSAPSAPLLWGFWGGALHPGETPATGAIREIAEELCICACADDFAVLGERRGKTGRAALLLYRRPLGWGDVAIMEGAGAAFFWRRDLEMLAVTRAVRWFVVNQPEVFNDR